MNLMFFLSYLLRCLFRAHHECKVKSMAELTSIITAIWEAGFGKLVVQGQPRQIVRKIPSQPLAANGGTCLSSRDPGKYKKDDFGPDQPGVK
jgi:hypothetical protein